ncbi:hypothetical protein B0H34DRAFT_208029 [Crassisporium funariophilum]|nr:hypothetical protein B0H34DRAFT_208029 [Crassisporium funariophilum]
MLLFNAIAGLLILLLPSTYAATNISIDDTETDVVYFPHYAWARQSHPALFAGGTLMISAGEESYATFTFNGTAIYFMSPLWPFRITTEISLDALEPQHLDLQDYTIPAQGAGPPTARSRIVAKYDGLANAEHTLRVISHAGETYTIVDMLIYTIESVNHPSSTSS